MTELTSGATTTWWTRRTPVRRKIGGTREEGRPMRYRTSMISRIILLAALAACKLGPASSGTRPMDPRTSCIFHADGHDGAADVVNGITATAVIAAAQP